MKIERTKSDVLKYRVKVGKVIVLAKSKERAAEIAACILAKWGK